MLVDLAMLAACLTPQLAALLWLMLTEEPL